jgi:hypothetical protein
MAAIIRGLSESTKQLYQEAEVLNDIISKSEEHFGAELRVGYALTSILHYVTAYCPAEPATSSMDIALRAAGIYRHMELNTLRIYEAYTSVHCSS